MAKPRRAIKRNSIRGPRQIENLWGKGERNEVFIMNFKEIHSNTEFLSTYRRAREIPLTGEMSRSDKRVCRIADLLLPKKINSNIYRKKTRTLSPCLFWRFPSFASGRYTRTAPLTKDEIYLTFSKSYSV